MTTDFDRRRFLDVVARAGAAAAAGMAGSVARAQTWNPVNAKSGSTDQWKQLCAKTGSASQWKELTTCEFLWDYTIPSGTLSFNVRNAASTLATAAGWNGVDPLKAILRVGPGSLLGAVNNTTGAFDTGVGFPTGSSILLVTKGDLVGCRGRGGDVFNRTPGLAGGPALIARVPMTVDNTGGRIGGGGGGGGAGEGKGWYYDTMSCGKYSCSPYTIYAYAGGGGGGEGAGATSTGPGRGDPTMTTYYVYRRGTNGNYGSTTGGGSPGVSSYGSNGPNDYIAGGYGGWGGNLGQAGNDGGYGGYGAEAYFYPTPFQWYPPTAKGAAGAAVIGNANITWINMGTILGAIT